MLPTGASKWHTTRTVTQSSPDTALSVVGRAVLCPPRVGDIRSTASGAAKAASVEAIVLADMAIFTADGVQLAVYRQLLFQKAAQLAAGRQLLL